MRVLGVDPGLTRCGLGVIDGAPGRTLTLVSTDVVRTAPGDAIGLRLLALEEQMERWLTLYQPDAVAVERVFSQHNVRTVMGTAQAGAVAIVCAARRGLPVALHTPSEVKAAVTGNGRAGKAQVTEMVTRLLKMPDPPRPADSADALALAICHLWRGGAQASLAAAAAAAAAARTPAGAAQVAAAQAATARAGTARAATARAAMRPLTGTAQAAVRPRAGTARAGTARAAVRPLAADQDGGQ